MDIKLKDYLKKIIENCNQDINQSFDFSEFKFSIFEKVNAFFLNHTLQLERTNILISLPSNQKIFDFILPSILIPALHSLSKNTKGEINLNKGDILISKKDGKICKIISILPEIKALQIGGIRPFILGNIYEYIILNHDFSEEIKNIGHRATLKQRQNGYNSLSKRIFHELNQYLQLLSLYKANGIQLPIKNLYKVVIIGQKNEIINRVPEFIPYRYINRNGIITQNLPFDPILIIANDFSTVKDFVINKGFPIDTIIFLGENKYDQYISDISRNYRLSKFNHCIFVGTRDIDTGENYQVLKWNWTLPEIKFFEQKQYKKPLIEIIEDNFLSNATLEFTNFIDGIENHYQNMIKLKRLLKFVRKIYPITAIANEKRIKERAEEVFKIFLIEAEEVLQDEYYSIDVDYKEDFNRLKTFFQNIINLIINSNEKSKWFKTAKDIDYIVVPKSIKEFIENEIENCFKEEQTRITINNLENIYDLFAPTQKKHIEYSGLKDIKIITISEFFNKDPEEKIHLFLSLFGNGYYPDVLLKKILLGNNNAKILGYKEEEKVLQFFLQQFDREYETEFRSEYREQICGIAYPDILEINTENIDEWIKHLIGLDEQKYTRIDEQRYEIIFEDDSKTIERESKKVFVDDYEDLYKEINLLKKGDKVRIYHNPDKETLHDIIKMTDEKDLFMRVDYYSSLWKNALREYFSNCHFQIDAVFEDLKINGLSVDKPRLEYWLKEDCKTKFPMKKRDLLAIIKTTNQPELNNNIQNIYDLKTSYSGKLVQAGVVFSEEINTYILSKAKGKMLDWLSDEHIEQIIAGGAPLRKIKSIKLIDEESTD